MWVSAVIVTCCFIGAILLIVTNKLNRAIAVLAGAIITYFTLTFLEGQNFSIFIDLLFGTSADEYVNLRALLLIVGMLLIVQVCHTAGVFQFIGFKLIQFTKGRPFYLLLMFCGLAVFISSILNNILAVIILIPLTIVATRILSIDPTPYIICEAIMVNVGGIFFSISSIPNILITTYADISFADFFLNVGLFAIFIFGITMLFFFIFYRNKLMIPRERLTEVLQDFNVWNYVPSRRIFYRAIIILISVMICFAAVPSNILGPDIIALTGGIGLVILSKFDSKEIIGKVDLELLLYLLGIFIITGGMELLGVIDMVGAGLVAITGNNIFVSVLVILWVSAFLSSSIDNIPITKVLIPVVDVMSTPLPPASVSLTYYSLAYGANLGDNLTPMGDNVLVMSISEQYERKISYSQFLKLGFIATIIQLIAISIYYTFIFNVVLGLFIIFIVFMTFLIVTVLRYLNRNYREDEEIIQNLLSKIKKQDYRLGKQNLIKRIIWSINKFTKARLGLGKD